MTTTKLCPQCGSARCARIIYGLPMPTRKLLQQMKSQKVVLGGPLEQEYSPHWKCIDCGAETYNDRRLRLPDPGRIHETMVRITG
jgi:hypothetical protein